MANLATADEKNHLVVKVARFNHQAFSLQKITKRYRVRTKYHLALSNCHWGLNFPSFFRIRFVYGTELSDTESVQIFLDSKMS